MARFKLSDSLLKGFFDWAVTAREKKGKRFGQLH